MREHSAFLIEDDWAHDLAIDADATPLAALDDSGHVVYLRSLTKSVSPSLRVGAAIARGPVRDRLLADRSAESLYVSGVLQAAALDVVTQPGWRAHLKRLQKQLRERRDLLADSIREHIPDAHIEALPRGGVSLWVRLSDSVDVERLAADCEARGVIIAAGNEWFPAEPSGSFIRLNYSGADPARFPEAAKTIAESLRSGRQ